MLGLESFKPVLTALLLPPVPFILLVLIGARLILPRRGLGWLIVLIGVTGLWLSTCLGTSRWLQRAALQAPAALSAENLSRLQSRGQASANDIAIVILGAGMVPKAPEYRVADLGANSAERLRYGIWLSRKTGLPMAFSGGVGWAQQSDDTTETEADIASNVALQTYGVPIRWIENHSSDTHSNAALTVPMLREAGVKEIVLVTSAVHMRRAERNFVEAAAGNIRITPAPMGYFIPNRMRILDWLPSVPGYSAVWQTSREILANAVGA